MNKATEATKGDQPERQRQAPAGPRRYTCANCDGEITVADNRNGGLVAVNVAGHAKAAHRVCPVPADPQS